MIDFTTETESKRCRQIDKCNDLMSEANDALLEGLVDTRKATYKLIKLRNYLNKELPDKKSKGLFNELYMALKSLADAVEYKHGVLYEECDDELGRALKSANDLLQKLEKSKN